MSTTLEQIMSQAIALSPDDHARLADLLLASLPDEADEALDAAWGQEIERRVKAVEAGTERLFSSSDVHADARKIYQR